MATNAELIAQLYIGFYNRAPDPVGLEYWLGRMDSGVSIQDIGDSFAASPEASETYSFFSNPGSDIEGFLSEVYLNVFGRPIDDDGMAYYLARLEAGEAPGSVVASILGNADTNVGSPDQQYIQNKVDAGLYWAEQASQSDVNIYLPNGRLNEAANDSAHGVIETVTSDPGSVGGSNGSSDDFFNPPTDGGGSTGGGSTGGGGGGGGGGVITVPDAYFGDLSAHGADGYLFAGTGNPATGFMIGKDSSGSIELGLDVRYDNNTRELTPIHDNIFEQVGTFGEDLRFSYSVRGIDLARYDYTLQVDTDPGAGQAWETFRLIPDANSGTPEDPNQSHYDWERVDGGGSGNITDDGGDAAGTTTQNIVAIQWLNGGRHIQGGEIYDINLTASLKGTDTIVAQTAIVLQSGGERTALNFSASLADDSGFLLAGTGNPNHGFSTLKISPSDILVGLTGWIENVGVVPGETIANVVHYALPSAASARFVYSVESLDDDMLSINTFKLHIDTDGSTNTNYQVFELAAFGDGQVNTADAGANIGDSNYQWIHISGNGNMDPITDDGGDGIAGKVTQNIQNIAWFDSNGSSDALAPGQYDILLEAYGADGVTLIGMNHIVLDIAA